MPAPAERRVTRLVFLFLLVVVLICVTIILLYSRHSPTVRHMAPGEVREVPVSEYTADDINAAMSAAGVQMYRFDYGATALHRLYFTIKRYADGKPVNSHLTIHNVLNGNAGQNTFRIITRVLDQKLCVMFSSHGWRTGGCDFSLQGYGSTTAGLRVVRLDENKPVPIFIFAANRKHGITDCSNTTPIEQVVRKYDMVIVVTAEVKR